MFTAQDHVDVLPSPLCPIDLVAERFEDQWRQEEHHELQVHFRVPAGVRVGPLLVNGDGKLVLLKQYRPLDAPTELIYPASGRTVEWKPPLGTELLLVCGRTAGPVNEAEVREAWGNAVEWPALEPSRLLQLQLNHIKDEGEKPRDVGAERDRPESDPEIRRLDALRERLAPKYPFLEGLAFCHE